MTEFIAGLFAGAILMFFAVGWLRFRAGEEAEPIEDHSLFADFDEQDWRAK